jgi:ankyrin repeat protein
MADELIEAIRSGDLAAIRPAIQANPAAASRGNARTMRAVLDAGRDLGCRDKQGRTPIDIARLAGRDELLAMAAAC